jgi:hypothetical protein
MRILGACVARGQKRDAARSVGAPATAVTFIPPPPVGRPMRSEEEIREQYEFLQDQLESDEMRHQGVRELFTHYKRALGWVLEEEHM